MDEIRYLRETDLLFQSKEESRYFKQKGRVLQFVSDTCLSSPLPTSPKTPKYSVTHTYTDGDELKMTFWRETCQDGTGSALLMKATPNVGSPFLCGPSFTIIQNSVQHNDIQLQSAPGANSFCNDLFVATTLIVNEYDFGQPQFDPSKVLTIIHDFLDIVMLDIPDATGTVSNITGVVDGYIGYNAKCKNRTTGTAVNIQGGSQVLDCLDAGLQINPGDEIKMTITGTAK